ncbi:hypothetical protein SRHO_G00275030 [Serrasalmus rhombeus]
MPVNLSIMGTDMDAELHHDNHTTLRLWPTLLRHSGLSRAASASLVTLRLLFVILPQFPSPGPVLTTTHLNRGEPFRMLKQAGEHQQQNCEPHWYPSGAAEGEALRAGGLAGGALRAPRL